LELVGEDWASIFENAAIVAGRRRGKSLGQLEPMI
jgi:hypothetical protein